MKEEHVQPMNIEDASAVTATVGAQQLGELKHHWSEYCSMTDPSNGPIDPIEALHRTGALLHAVGDVIVSEKHTSHSSS